MAGISQTKTYGVSYILYGNSENLTKALAGAKTQAEGLQTALAQANANLHTIFGGKADVPKAITELRDFYKEWATANKTGGSSLMGKGLEKQSKILKDTQKKLKQIQDSPFTIKNGMIGQEAFTNIQKQIDQHVFNVKVKPVLSGDAHATLQEQLNTKEFTINVKANVTGIQQQKSGTTAPASSSAKASRPITRKEHVRDFIKKTGIDVKKIPEDQKFWKIWDDASLKASEAKREAERLNGLKLKANIEGNDKLFRSYAQKEGAKWREYNKYHALSDRLFYSNEMDNISKRYGDRYPSPAEQFGQRLMEEKKKWYGHESRFPVNTHRTLAEQQKWERETSERFAKEGNKLKTYRGVGDGPIVKKPYSSPTASATNTGITQLKQGLTQLQNYIKANPLTGNFRVNYGESRTQVQRIIGNLRQYAMTKPIRVPVEVVWGNAGGQLQNILSGLQSFANGHGIKTTAKVSGTATGGSTGTGSTLTDEQKKESAIRSAARSKWSSMLDKQLGNYYPGWKEEQMSKYDKWAAKFPGMAGAERLQNFSENYRQRQLRQTSLDKANKQAERIEKQHQANKQRVTDSVMRDIEKNNRAEIKERERLARESQKAQERIAREQAKAQERLIKEQERAAQRQAREQAKAQKIAQQRANAQRYVPGGPNGPVPPGGRGDIYTRMRKSWYPFTGNTSFGARTPMALDMAKGMGMMFAVSGVMQAVTSSFHQVAEYENMMKTVQAILKTNDGGANFNGRFKAMEEEVRRVGRETKFTAPEVAGAARFMAMAGLGIEDINAATNPIANLALVGDNDMSTTADKMTNIMTSFGLLKGLSATQKKANMRHTSDILTNTFTKSNTDLMQLAEAMQYAGPMSHLTGTSLEDAAAMVGVMGNAGIQASMAGTTLRMMYQNIIKPNKKQAAEWKRLGINTKDGQGRNRDIFEILKDLRAKITGTTDLNSKVGADQLKIMGAEVMSLFRTTAGAGTAALLENLGEAINLAKSNRESNGVAQTIADEKKNTISGLWAQVTSTFTDQSVNTVNEFVETIKDMLRSLRDWLASKEAANTLKEIYSLAKSLIEVFGSVAKIWLGIYNFAPSVVKFFISFQLWATQLGFLTTPIIQVTGAIATLKNTLLGLLGVSTTVSGGLARGMGGYLPIAANGIGVSRIAQSNIANGGLVLANIQGGRKRIPESIRQDMMAYRAANWPNNMSSYAMGRDRVRSLTKIYKNFDPTAYGTMAVGTGALTANNIARFYNGNASLPSAQLARLQMRNMLVEAGRETNALRPSNRIPRYYNTAGITKVMPFYQYANNSNAVLYGGTAITSLADTYRRKSGQYNTLALRLSPDDKRRGELFAKANKMMRAADVAEAAQKKARFAAAAQRHATRTIGNDVLLRGMSMGKFGYKGAFGAALQSGITMGAWSGINGIKQIFQSLGLYLAKGIGLLMSPVGAVTAGLVTLGVTLYKVYEHVKEVNRQHEVAIINYQKMSDALSKDRENLINMGNAIGGFSVINSGYQREMSSTPTSYTLPTEYTKGILNDTGKLLPSEIVKSYVSLYGKYLPSGTIETFLKRTPDYTSMSNYEDPHDLFGGATVKNEKGSKNAQRLAVVAQWAKFATEQDDVQKAARAILEAQSKGDLKQVHAILDQFKVPTNVKSMLSMNKNAEELSKLENADKTFEFMYAQLNYLKEIADKMDIPIQNYTKAMELIDELSKQKGKISSDSIKELSTTLLRAQSVSWRGKTGSLILGKDNKVDWLAMAKQFNESIPFTLAEQQQIMYDALDNIFDNENMDKIPEIATLVARYLPLLQNLTPFDSNGLSYTSNSIQSVANKIKDSQKHFTGMASENADERESMVKNIMQWIRSRKGDRGQDLTQQNIDNLYALLKKWGYDKKGHKIVAPEKNTSITPPDQSAYDSKYNNHQARPTQIIFNIDQLCKFEGTQVNSLDQKGIAESVGRQMAEGLHLMFAQAASDFAIIGDSNG